MLTGRRTPDGTTTSAREEQAVWAMVEHGPVLDVPLGTGRYLDIYSAKGLDAAVCDISEDKLAETRRTHPEVMAFKGTVFNLPCIDGQFATVVCSRLLNRFYPHDMARAVAEIARVGREVVLSLTTGEEGMAPHRGNYTHGLDKFYAAIDGLFIADRRVIKTYADGSFEMLRLRPPRWPDVVKQFDWHPDGHDAIHRLTRKWCDRYGIDMVELSTGVVRAQYWTHEQIAGLIDTMADVPRCDGTRNKLRTKKRPHTEAGPMTVFTTQGRTALIDGRRRANKWMNLPGRYPVLLIEV